MWRSICTARIVGFWTGESRRLPKEARESPVDGQKAAVLDFDKPTSTTSTTSRCLRSFGKMKRPPNNPGQGGLYLLIEVKRRSPTLVCRIELDKMTGAKVTIENERKITQTIHMDGTQILTKVQGEQATSTIVQVTRRHHRLQ